MIDERKLILGVLVGDIVCAVAVTVIGFMTHYGGLRDWKFLSSLIPVIVSWLLIAPWLGNFDKIIMMIPTQTWRAGYAAILAAPLAAFFRGVWLNTPILPIFIAVLAITNALGFIIWRLSFALILKRIKRNG